MPVWLASLLGVGDPSGGLVGRILAFIPNPEEKAKAQAEMQKTILEAAFQAESDQRKIDATEASSSSLFVAGWRPAVGWLCVLTLAYQWMLVPAAIWIVGVAHAHNPAFNLPAFPKLGSDETQTLLYALLGIGTLRTADKVTATLTGTSSALTKGIKGVFSRGGG